MDPSALENQKDKIRLVIFFGGKSGYNPSPSGNFSVALTPAILSPPAGGTISNLLNFRLQKS